MPPQLERRPRLRVEREEETTVCRDGQVSGRVGKLRDDLEHVGCKARLTRAIGERPAPAVAEADTAEHHGDDGDQDSGADHQPTHGLLPDAD